MSSQNIYRKVNQPGKASKPGRRQREQLREGRAPKNEKERQWLEQDGVTNRNIALSRRNRSRDGRSHSRDRRPRSRSPHRRRSRSPDRRGADSRHTADRGRSPGRSSRTERHRSLSRDRSVRPRRSVYRSRTPTRSGRSRDRYVPERRGEYQRSRSRDGYVSAYRGEYKRSRSRDRRRSPRRGEYRSHPIDRYVPGHRGEYRRSPSRARRPSPRRSEDWRSNRRSPCRSRSPARSKGNGKSSPGYDRDHTKKSTPLPANAQTPGSMQPPKQPASKRQSVRNAISPPKSGASLPSADVVATKGANVTSQVYPSPVTSTVVPAANVEASTATTSSSQDVTMDVDVVLGDDEEPPTPPLDQDLTSGSEYREDEEEESDGGESEDEEEDYFVGKPLPDQPADKSTKGAAPTSDLQQQAAAQSISPRECYELVETLFEPPAGMSELTKRVRDLYGHNNHPLKGIDICQGRHLGHLDVLSLLYVKGLDRCAWFTDAVVHALLALEGPLQPSVCTDLDLSIFLHEDYVENALDREIEKAKSGEPLEFGYPFQDVTSDHERIMGVINPSGNHWLTFEFVLETDDDLPTLFYYNSLQHAKQRGPSYRAVKDTLPKLLHLASFQPNSPLAGLEADDVVVTEVDCPQQAGSHECGPMSIFCYTRRLHDLPVSVDLPHHAAKHAFGEWTRSECVGRFVQKVNGIPDSLRERFADPLPTFADAGGSREDNNRRLQEALDYLVEGCDDLDSADELFECKDQANLIQELEEQGCNYDVELFGTVRDALAQRQRNNMRVLQAMERAENEDPDDNEAGSTLPERSTGAGERTLVDTRPADTETFSWTLPGTNDAIDGTVGQLEISVLSCPVFRIEIGAPGPGITSIIVVMRYSGLPHQWSIHRKHCADTDQEIDMTVWYVREMVIAENSVAAYMGSIGKAGDRVHLIVYSGTRLQTVTLPSVGHDERYMSSSRRLLPGSLVGHDIYDNDDNGGNDDYSGPACPVCDYDAWRRTKQGPDSELSDDFKDHVVRTHICGNKVSVETDATGKARAACNWWGCYKVCIAANKLTRNRRAAARALLISHQKHRHVRQWVRDQIDARENPSKSPDLPTISNKGGRETASEVPRSLKSIIREYISTRKCFYCPGAPPVQGAWKLLLHQYETHAAPDDAEFRCDHEIFTHQEVTRNWDDLPEAFQKRFLHSLRESGDHCPWDDSRSGCQEQFDNLIELRDHCDAIHADEPVPWSITTENQCGLAFASNEELRNHRFVCHENGLLRDTATRSPERGDWWTRAITTDLDELVESTTTGRPVLLSVGADAFTCNPLLMSMWLQERDRRFDFAITHADNSTLKPRYLTRVGKLYVTTYDVQVLSRYPRDTVNEDPRHADLLDYWERLQGTKDMQSKNTRSRNRALRMEWRF